MMPLVLVPVEAGPRPVPPCAIPAPGAGEDPLDFSARWGAAVWACYTELKAAWR